MAASELRLSEIVAALSHALDLTEGQPRGHAVRTCLIGMQLAEEIGLEPERRGALFYALLLKDAGCSSNASRVNALFRADDHAAKRAMKTVDFPRLTNAALFALRTAGRDRGVGVRLRATFTLARNGRETGRELVAIRCERGAEIARMLGFHDETAAAIRSLDEHWNGKGYPDGLRGEGIPLLARIACLAQTFEVFHADRGLDAALAMTRGRRGRWFDPGLVDALHRICRDGDVASLLAAGDVAAVEPAEAIVTADESQLDQIAEAFARVIDAKSPYTHRHSERVADIATAIGDEVGFDPPALRRLRRAALLHDIGKLAVPNTILDKPGRLDDDERRLIETHATHSEEILGHVAAFADLAELAGAHHERLDGSGYPRGRSRDQLSPAMRLLAVADVFEALTADRPYRAALSNETAFEIMRSEAGTKLCEQALAALERRLAGQGTAASEPLAA
jgi:putative nucleotidyltransferase with HDIG domain